MPKRAKQSPKNWDCPTEIGTYGKPTINKTIQNTIIYFELQRLEQATNFSFQWATSSAFRNQDLSGSFLLCCIVGVL